MNAVTLIAEIKSAGGQIEARGDKLHLSAPKPLPVELLTKLREFKAEVLNFLAADATPEPAAEHTAVHEPDGVSELFRLFYGHLMGPAKLNNCCFAPNDRYCTEGQRLHDAYQDACREGGAS